MVACRPFNLGVKARTFLGATVAFEVSVATVQLSVSVCIKGSVLHRYC